MMKAPSLTKLDAATTTDSPSPSRGQIPYETSDPSSRADLDNQRIIDAATGILEQGEALLLTLSDDAYTRRIPAAFNASIGGHFRHCLDHFSSLLRALDADIVDYDHRDRDERIETDRRFAQIVAGGLRETLTQIPPTLLGQPIGARCEVHYTEAACPVTRSSLGRELVYTIAHAIHHYALISVMAKLMHLTLPPDFGIAPSTLAHQHQQLQN